ncbi:unnamed protein product [Mortierella alpina]
MPVLLTLLDLVKSVRNRSWSLFCPAFLVNSPSLILAVYWSLLAEQPVNKRSSSMNPLAPTFTPTMSHKSTLSDCATTSECGSEDAQSHRAGSRPSLSRNGTADSRDALIKGLGISSPQPDEQQATGLGISSSLPTSVPQSSVVCAEPSPKTATSASTMMTSCTSTTNTSAGAATTTTEFDPEEFQKALMRHITDKLETGLDRHLSQFAPTTKFNADGLSDGSKVHNSSSSEGISSSSVLTTDSSLEESTIAHLKNLLRHSNTELDRLKEKNDLLLETNHRLERKQLEAAHQVARLQDFEKHHQFLVTRVKELESNGVMSVSADRVLETASMNGQRHHARHGSSVMSNGSSSGSSTLQYQQIQRLQRELETLTKERDAFKIRSWELEKRPFTEQQPQQSVRTAHFVDLENERNRLLEELCLKTVAMEDLYSKNDALSVRAKEYEERVWELETQVAKLEASTATTIQLRSELLEWETRATSSEAMIVQLQAMEGGQVALVKSLQDRISELETTNAEINHANRGLSEKLNIANNQHTLLTKEFESFRSKDKDDRRLEFLATRNRELEGLLTEQAKIQPDYKEEYDRVASELEKVKIRMPQLEGQAKQVALLRSKTLQLEKQIKTMESLEPRLEEMQQLHERNLFLEGELGELEQLRAKEMELELELGESKAKLLQLEATQKTRMQSFSGLKQVQSVQQQHARANGRARSGSVAQSGPPPFMLQHLQQAQQQHHQIEEDRPSEIVSAIAGVRDAGMLVHTTNNVTVPQHGCAVGSIGTVPPSPHSPRREFPSAVANVSSTSTTVWPSGRSSMSMSSHSLQRMSTGSSASSSSSTVGSSSSAVHVAGSPMPKALRVSTPASPLELSSSADEFDAEETKHEEAMAKAEEPASLDTAIAPIGLLA